MRGTLAAPNEAMATRSILFFALTALLSGCGPQPSGGSTPEGTLPLVWQDDAVVVTRNRPVPRMSAATICGSSSATFLSELRNTSPTKAKVKQEWADIVRGGRQVAISGVVETTHLGPQDLPMSHELGDDLSMNVRLDAAFAPYTRRLGKKPSEEGETDHVMHVEIAAGYVPHLVRPSSPDTGQTWEQMADHNRTSFQPGFDKPLVGNRALIQGRYIIDCGHGSYHTELHAMSFLAWARQDADTTTVRVYYNPYRDTERYNPDFSILGDVRDTKRLSLATTSAFPGYLLGEVVRALAGQTKRLRSYGILDAEQVSPADWRVCAPAATYGSRLEVAYDFVARKGVTITALPDVSRGCVQIQTVIGAGYTPAPIELRHCVLPWPYLNKIARGAISDPKLDLKQSITDAIGADNAGKIAANPEVACGDALAGPRVDPEPRGTSIRVDDDQPFPFYGVVSVRWKP